MKYLVIDASLNGTGIRDYYEGGYINPNLLDLGNEIKLNLKKWLLKYEEEHYNGFANELHIESLDNEGKEIARIIRKELGDVKIEYYSEARLKKESI